MPEKKTVERARRAKREGKAPTTQAGEFVREEMEHMKQGKHEVKNSRQAIAIGLSKARQSGVDVPPRGRKKAARKTSSKKTAGRRKAAPRRKTAARKKAAPRRKAASRR